MQTTRLVALAALLLSVAGAVQAQNAEDILSFYYVDYDSCIQGTGDPDYCAAMFPTVPSDETSTYDPGYDTPVLEVESPSYGYYYDYPSCMDAVADEAYCVALFPEVCECLSSATGCAAAPPSTCPNLIAD